MFENQRSVDMTSSGKNGLNIRPRINASPKWDRTKCPELIKDISYVAKPKTVKLFWNEIALKKQNHEKLEVHNYNIWQFVINLDILNKKRKVSFWWCNLSQFSLKVDIWDTKYCYQPYSTSGYVINSQISQAWKGWVDSKLNFKKSVLGKYLPQK